MLWLIYFLCLFRCSFCISWLLPQFVMIFTISTVKTRNLLNFSSNLQRSEQWVIFNLKLVAKCLCAKTHIQTVITIFLDVLLQLLIEYVITYCRTWLCLGLCCFSLEWKTPFLKGNQRRLQKQKHIRSSVWGHFFIKECRRLFPGSSL